MSTNLKVELRDSSASNSQLKQMRKSGRIPAVVYGKKIGSLPISVDEKALSSMLRSNQNGVITMDMPDQGSHPVMVGGLDRHKINRNVLHIDFHQINMNEPIQAKVSLEIHGDSPGVREGGVMTSVLHEIEVRCLPDQLPSELRVDISELNTGDSVLAGDLKLPSGVELKTDPDSVLVTVLVPQKAVEELEDAIDDAEGVPQENNSVDADATK